MNRWTKLQGILLDFDGLILDTETAVYQAWQELYRSWGEQLKFEEWITLVGKSDQELDPMDRLEDVVGADFNREQAQKQVAEREMELIAGREPLPGVLELIEAARAGGLPLGVASSSTREWVITHLTRLGLLDRFAAVSCSDDVPRAKPDPALYRLSLDKLGLKPEQAVVFEDSPAGVLAAKRAGLYCVAVPNGITRRMKFHDNGGGPDMVLNSLEEFPLEYILRR
jgi:HAD superfamily hydrolase (TIGR01509 family)